MYTLSCMLARACKLTNLLPHALVLESRIFLTCIAFMLARVVHRKLLRRIETESSPAIFACIFLKHDRIAVH